jgi:hypothetical protein
MWVVANGMEILTFVIQGVFSQGFTLLVACSVSLKQISILTASATRGTFYKQFAGRNENLGDITAKGDAQVCGLGFRVLGVEFRSRLPNLRDKYVTAKVDAAAWSLRKRGARLLAMLLLHPEARARQGDKCGVNAKRTHTGTHAHTTYPHNTGSRD